MSDTHHVQVQGSAVSIQSSDKIEDAFKKMKVDEKKVLRSNAYPVRPGERDCQYYLRTGLCGYGSSCRYNHPTPLPQGIMYHNEGLPERIGQPDCEYFLKTGACKYGSTCKYHHPKDRNGAEPVLFNVLSLPMRQGEKPCSFYLRTGTCRFGVSCRFHHPQPDNGGHSTAAYGTSSFPSAGVHYAGGLTMMSAYGALTRPQLPQSYVPLMVSPSQGLLAPQSWATYMGQPACGNVKSYGFCKFGPNCNLDHSMLPYPGLTIPYVSPVSSNYQRITPSPSRSGSKTNDKPDVKKDMLETEKPDDDF